MPTSNGVRWAAALAAAAVFACGSGSSSAYTLTIDVEGPGAVGSSALAADCRSSCAVTLAAGSAVELDATPDSNMNFQGWTGCSKIGSGAMGPGGGVVSTCYLTLSSNAQVSAAFTK
jgi:hypothetical protein